MGLAKQPVDQTRTPLNNLVAAYAGEMGFSDLSASFFKQRFDFTSQR
jgi:hypothetical protein